MNLLLRHLLGNIKNILFLISTLLVFLLLLNSLIYTIGKQVKAEQQPITPINPLYSTTVSSTSPMSDIQSKAIEQDSSTGPSTTQTKDEPSIKNLIFEGTIDQFEENNGESINTFIINKAIETNELSTIVTSLAVTKLTPENMESIGHKGQEGLVDIDLQLKNTSQHPIEILTDEIKFTVGETTYPLSQKAAFKNQIIQPGETIDEYTLTFTMAKLPSADSLTELSFNWQTSSHNDQLDYQILLLLKKETDTVNHP